MIYGAIALVGPVVVLLAAWPLIRRLELDEIAWFIAGAVALFVLMFGGAMWATSTTCERIGVQVDRPTEWYVNGGCFVTLDNGRSVPIDENSIGLFLEVIDDSD